MRWPVLSLLFVAACRAPAPAPLDSGVPPVEDAGAPPCFSAFPERLDFGEVEANVTAFTHLRLTNLTDRVLQPRPRTLAPPFSFDGASFEALAPGASKLITVRFTPAGSLLHFGELEITAAGECEVVVPLRGLGKGAFSVLPSRLDFGPVDPGTSRGLELTLSNTQRSPVVLDRLELAQPADVRPFSLDASVPLIIPPQRAVTLTVTASPPGFDVYDGALRLGGPAGTHEVQLLVFGGVPFGSVTPTVIDVPKAHFTPGSFPRSFIDRVVLVKNVADGGSPLSTLELVSPVFTALRPDGGEASQSEVEISFFGSIPAGAVREVLVRVTPPGLGVHRYQLVMFTNAPLTPALRVDLTVNALSLPRCSLEYPASVTFTALPDAGSVGFVRFTNDAGVSCVLDGLRANSLDFRITDGGVDQVELAPGEVHDVSLAGPREGSRRSSLLVFQVLGPDSSHQAVELVAP